MLLAVVVSLIVYSRETISDNQNTPSQAKVWNVLELRILVAVSLFLQMVLIFLGNRRKYIVDKRLKLLIWFTYLSADWIATVALGILSKDTKDHKKDTNFAIMAIWAPFLLVHLGGPDTITAYSLEDNQLWPRHMLELLYQLAVAVYVVYRSWNTNPLKYVTVPIVMAGIIKYGERTWSLRSGSSDGFRESILPPPDPGPNYAKFMDDYTAKKEEGYHVTLDEINETTPLVLDHNSQGETGILNADIPDAQALCDGFKYYNIPECLFADLIFSFQDHKSSQFFFHGSNWKDAFKAIEVELGLIYDMLYTKAVITYSYHGILLKSVSFFCTLFAFIAFSFLIFKQSVYIKLDFEGHKHWNYDLIITFVLFIGAILLEIYAVIVLLSSSWVMNWLSKHKSRRVDLLYKFVSFCQFCFKLSHTIRWSNQMSQFNLISFCLKDESVKCIKLQKLFCIYKFFEKSYYQKTKQVSEGLKELIFDQLKEKSEEAEDIQACKKLCAHKGERVLKKWRCDNVPDINRSIQEVEFDQSILLWHIATVLCYSSDDNQPQDLNHFAHQSREESQLLSDYMLNLLVISPFLLPNGIGQIRFEDTCAEVDELLKERKYIKERSQVCKMILRVNTDIPPSEVKGDRSKSVLFDACRLAKSLQSLETEENWSKERKWKMISNVWVEMLCHAASQCRGLNHARQLSQGGELLTHVWLLMAHLGITEQFQISKGHVRAKLKLS
ncbi:putative transmembrane protein [Trifolium repens]|nr:putative transmembrane protein [Trifolium repens]